MKAAIQHALMATPVIEELENPTPGEGEVLIHVRTAALGGQDAIASLASGPLARYLVD